MTTWRELDEQQLEKLRQRAIAGWEASASPTYEHGWETATLKDRTRLHRTTVRRTDIQTLDPMTSIAIRARNRQSPPAPDSPERFYRQERFGPSDSRVYTPDTTADQT